MRRIMSAGDLFRLVFVQALRLSSAAVAGDPFRLSWSRSGQHPPIKSVGLKGNCQPVSTCYRCTTSENHTFQVIFDKQKNFGKNQLPLRIQFVFMNFQYSKNQMKAEPKANRKQNKSRSEFKRRKAGKLLQNQGTNVII